MEERWEAIEACEREFGQTIRRAGSDTISLAQLPDGLELVRIGNIRRPEFAAWRYGRRLLKRQWHHRANGWLQALVAAGTASPAAPLMWPILLPWMINDFRKTREVVARGTLENGEILPLRRRDARTARLDPDSSAEGWCLRLKHRGDHVAISGAEGLRLAALLLPHVNTAGASESQVRSAVERIEHAGGPEAFIRGAARVLAEERLRNSGAIYSPSPRIIRAPAGVRLALEMSAHEELERYALEADLRVLERSWREAEEIAAIADNLLLPATVRNAMRRLGAPSHPSSDAGS